jgi:hypothetical protein
MGRSIRAIYDLIVKERILGDMASASWQSSKEIWLSKLEGASKFVIRSHIEDSRDAFTFIEYVRKSLAVIDLDDDGAKEISFIIKPNHTPYSLRNVSNGMVAGGIGTLRFGNQVN